MVTKTFYEPIVNQEETIGFIGVNVGIQETPVDNVPYFGWSTCKDLYIPPKYYLFPAPLLQEWVELIPPKPHYKPPIASSQVFKNSQNIVPRRSKRKKSRPQSSRRAKKEPLDFTLDNHSIDPSTNYSGTFNLSRLAPMHAGTSDIYGEWELSVTIIALKDPPDSGMGTWKIAFTILGSKFKANETSRSKGNVRFGCTQQLVLRCLRSCLLYTSDAADE